ncbi:MAG: non-heme iron oxygenase ferredoxin subunit [Candidatus Aenigmarchaeota archaeon]|nr:non-heme iron oxygenase ferredoxin subunit [Candidatus Aenigmarchaeota archaeon]
MSFVKAAKVSDVPEGKMKMVTVSGEDVCLINSGGKFYAVEELCTHEDGPMHEGHLEDGKVVCPWHQARFDVKTGKADPGTDWASRDLKTFKAKVEGEDVLVEV